MPANCLSEWLTAAASVYTAHTHLHGFPGPRLAAYTRLWMVEALRSEKCSTWYLETNERYGPLARIGPNNLLTSDPEVFRQVLGARSKYERGTWFDCLRLDPHRANLITERDRIVHNQLRAKMAAGYDGKDVENFESTIDENLACWLRYVDRHGLSAVNTTVEFDIARSIQWLLFDMICRLCLGEPVGFVEDHKDHYHFQKTLEERLPVVEKFAVMTEVNSWIRFISMIPFLRRVLPSSRDQDGIGAVLGLAETSLKQRQRPDYKPRKDILGSWLRHDVNQSLLPSEITIALFAGSDTTATSVRALLLHIISNPLIYIRLTDEIAVAHKEGIISQPCREVEISRLSYLQACIKEGLRVFPPITALRERVVPAGGDTLRGHFIPGGTRIGLNLLGLLTHEVFGRDPKVFRPERWLEAAPQQLRSMERVHELMFNWGFTRCLGIRLANLMISKFMIEVFRRWDVTTTRPQKPWDSRCHGIFYQKDFFVRITPRTNSE
ncbi:putative benzoate 4-monooxygenase cytochrome P450 [Zopfia rhizophila CBS 207.26]|uniref:Putative benzoate 4-monooxygenase cytochrome P450 n=1 Tax=Zopfia rhizophila CBS 207.26 TaxID=1314779 RepID=A0A6A6EBP4_9PEZI|nr:putative benzoate 4-monooxygenase cytochrome P450 [Zopfia rhizophila CBS 207.26]